LTLGLALGTLFLAAFVAATFVPFQSEVVFVGLQVLGEVDVLLLVMVASIGNTLGSFINYWLGAGLETFRGRKWFPVREDQLARARDWYQRYGVWTLLMSWAPFAGWFTVVAGIMRTPLWIFAVLVTIAKTGRYAGLAWLTAQATGTG